MNFDKYDVAIVGTLIIIMWLTTIAILCVVSIIALSCVPPDTIKERTIYKTDYYMYPTEINEISQTNIHVNNTIKVINETKIVRVINVTTVSNPQKITPDILQYANQIIDRGIVKNETTQKVKNIRQKR